MKKRLWIALMAVSALVGSNAQALFAAPGLSKGDQKFQKMAAHDGMSEVQLGQSARNCYFPQEAARR
jgi:hypothetical protein